MSIDFKQLNQAKNFLGLHDNKASLKEIKKAYRRACMQYHPDKCKRKNDDCEEMMKKLNEAYKIILSYCESYEYSFSKEEFDYSNQENILAERFKDDWLCS